jgi:hypothetical protein
MKQAPSALSVPKAYSISRSAPSTSGSGSVANMPKRVGRSETSRAKYSLHSRARARAAAASPKYTLGSLVDMIAVATPSRSISSSAFAGVQFISGI